MNVRLAVWKFASCDGCQLSLLDCEDELLALAEHVEIASFLEASSARSDGPYDVSLVEGSISTERDIERIRSIRDQSRTLVAIGACATAGGIQALRNTLDLDELRAHVYPSPEYVDSLAESRPISEFVSVDVELRGCPIDRRQLLGVLSALLAGRSPQLSPQSVCADCKLRGTPCVLVAHGAACLGPVTHGGCGAICPAFHRGCYGCFGPAEAADPVALQPALCAAGATPLEISRLYRTFQVGASAFRDGARSAEAIR